MDRGDYEPDPAEEEPPKRPRDRQIDEAKKVIMDRYLGSGTNVYYARQIEIWLEKVFFPLDHQAGFERAGRVQAGGFTIEQLEHHKAHFYYPPRHRYPRRQIREIIGLIAAFSNPSFTRAVGHYGEMLVESGFARTGFRILQQKVRAVIKGRGRKPITTLIF